MVSDWLDWLAYLALGYRYQPITWAIALVMFVWLGIARGQWLAAFVFSFSIVYALGWLVFGGFFAARHNWIDDPFFEGMLSQTLLSPLLFFPLCALISGGALWRGAPMKSAPPVVAALLLAHLFNAAAIAIMIP